MQAQQRPARIERFDTIDLLRGVSVLGVVYLHMTQALFYLADHKAVPVWLELRSGNFGWMGVACFFAISGFLITFNSIHRYGSLGAMRPLSFYRIRFARIAPPLIFVLIILCGLHLAGVRWFVIDPKISTLPSAIFAVLTFQFNRLQALHGWFPFSWLPLWTLSVEEMFYLCFPLVCTLLLRRRWSVPLFFVALASFVVMGPLARCGPNVDWAYHSYLGNMDNIALGCLTALLVSYLRTRSAWKHPIWLWSLRIVGVALMVLADASALTGHRHILSLQMLLWKTSTSVTVFGLGTCLVMLGSVLDAKPGLRITAPLRHFGRYSYEIYLCHTTVLIGVILLYNRLHQGLRGRTLTLAAVATFVLCGVVGLIVSRILSEPLNRILRGARLPAELPAAATAA